MNFRYSYDLNKYPGQFVQDNTPFEQFNPSGEAQNVPTFTIKPITEESAIAQSSYFQAESAAKNLTRTPELL